MTTIFEKYAAARAKYPDDIRRIADEEDALKKLLQLKEYSQHEATKALLEQCRKDVIECRRKLATDRSLLGEPDVQADLWAIIDARLWFIGLVARDFDGEIAMIEAGLDAELQR